jgi:hypothetical protein
MRRGNVLHRTAAIVALIVVALVSGSALAEDAACKSRSSGPNFIEWIERGQLRGVRLLSHDPKWQVQGGQHVTAGVVCKSCADGSGLGAALSFGVASPGTYNVERAISPDSVAKFTRGYPFRFTGVHPRDESKRVDATVGPLAGRARVFSVQLAGGATGEVIALAVVQNCLSIFGIFYHGALAPIVPVELEAFTGAVDLEFYTPPPEPQRVRPPIDFPLGDEYRRRYMK